MDKKRDLPARAAPSRFERHPLLTAACLLVILVLTMLAVTEWIVAGSAETVQRPGSTASLFQHRALIVREWQPNRDHRFGTPPERKTGSDEPVQDWYRLDIDSMGFIKPSLVHASPDLEIAFIGGSTTECLYMDAQERFPYLAGRLLEQAAGLKVNSINAGKSGNNSMHSLIAYLGKIAPLKPRYVVLLNAANDVGVLTHHESYWNGDDTYGLLRERERSLKRLGEDLRAITFPYTFALLSDGWRAVKATAGGWFSASAQDAAIQQDGRDHEKRKAFGGQFEASLRSFVRLARAWGSRPVLMTQVLVRPDGKGGFAGMIAPEQLARGDFDPASFASIQDYANAIIRQVALSEDALLIDLAEARAWQHRQDVYDGLHLTASGSRRVAQIIAAALAEDMARTGN